MYVYIFIHLYVIFIHFLTVSHFVSLSFCLLFVLIPSSFSPSFPASSSPFLFLYIFFVLSWRGVGDQCERTSFHRNVSSGPVSSGSYPAPKRENGHRHGHWIWGQICCPPWRPPWTDKENGNLPPGHLCAHLKPDTKPWTHIDKYCWVSLVLNWTLKTRQMDR